MSDEKKKDKDTNPYEPNTSEWPLYVNMRHHKDLVKAYQREYDDLLKKRRGS